MTSIAWTTADPVALAKALTTYAKANPSFTFKAGFVEGRAVEVKNIQELASMPSKEELIAKVMFLINSSAQRLAVSLAGVARNLAVVIDQAAKEGKFAS
jgi:large subunit ribosomal protein L10